MDVEKKAGRIMYLLMAILVILAVVIVIQQREQLGGIYMYSNGDSEFEVRPVQVDKSLQYNIKIFFPDNPQPYIITLRYDPLKLENISIDRKIKAIISDDSLAYVTIDPDQNLTGRTTVAALEIDKFLDNYRFYNIPVRSALTKRHKEGDTVRSCEHATDDISIIWLRTGDSTEVYSEGNCIIVQGTNEEEIIRAADRLSLLLLGIMR